jgi:hypothetical protein
MGNMHSRRLWRSQSRQIQSDKVGMDLHSRVDIVQPYCTNLPFAVHMESGGCSRGVYPATFPARARC